MNQRITLEEKTYDVDVENDDSQTPSAAYAPATFVSPVAAPVPPLAVGGGKPAPATVAENNVCRSPMVGIIVRINVREGEHVEKDDPIVVLEAMKMETTITSPVAGRVRSILVSAGESVQSGQVLVEFE
jgi:methylmalonyl-CoA carboxyltransferase small subunit